MAATAHPGTAFHDTAGRRLDKVLVILVATLTIMASMTMVLIALFLLNESAPILRTVGLSPFFTDEGWWPRERQYNLLPMLVSSILLTIGALAIATPFSVVFSIFCNFYSSRRFASVLRRLVDVSSAVPTVIYGFWGLVVLVPIIAAYTPPGVSLLAGMLVLALMVFPTITIISDSAIAAVPDSCMQAGTALGIKRSAIIRHVVLRSARSGIVSAVILGAARAIGETMVVLMVCGNVVQVPSSLFDPVRALTANIALEMPYAMGNHRSSLYVTGLFVFLIVTCLVLLNEIYAHQQSRGNQ